MEETTEDKLTKSDNRSGPKSLDDLLVGFGCQFSSYQRRVVFAVCFVSFSTAFNNLGVVFWAGRPDFHCAPSPWNGTNASLDATLNLTVPWEKDGTGGLRRSQCFQFASPRYGLEDTGPAETWREKDGSWNDSKTLSDLQECQSWMYDKSQYKSTIVTEWNLVCSRRWLVSLTQSTYMAGRIVGTLIYGHLSDRFGRRVALMTSIVLQFVCSFSLCFVPNIYMFLCLRFILGIQTTGEFQTAFVIVTEMVGPAWRVFAGTLIQLFWGVAYMTMAGIAYGIRHRIYVQVAFSVPLCLLFLLYWVVPETPRWLLARGRRKECIAVLRNMAADNDSMKDLNDDALVSQLLQLEDGSSTVRTKSSPIDLFRTPYIRRTTCILLFSWFVNSFVFYGLSLSSSSFGGNDYLNFFFAGLVEVPAYLAFLFSFTRFGRPVPFCVAMTVAGLALISILFVPTEITWVVVALAMLGKAAITCSYAMIYLYSSEVYPTVMRSTGVGAGALFARIGGVVAPQAAELSYSWRPLPAIIFGCLSLAAGLTVVFLPETKNRPMPQTVSDGEELNSDSLCNNITRQCRSRKVVRQTCNSAPDDQSPAAVALC